MMPHFTLPFKYEEETQNSGLTGLAGLPLYLEMLHSLNIPGIMRKKLDADSHKPKSVIRKFADALGWKKLG